MGKRKRRSRHRFSDLRPDEEGSNPSEPFRSRITRAPQLNPQENVISPGRDLEGQNELPAAVQSQAEYNFVQEPEAQFPSAENPYDDLMDVSHELEDELLELTAVSDDNEAQSEFFDGDAHNGAQRTLKISDWRTLWGILMTSGSQKMTKHQYQAMRMVASEFGLLKDRNREKWVNACGENPENTALRSLPHYSTLSSKYRPILYRDLAVRSSDFHVAVDTRKPGARVASYGSSGEPQVPIRIVLPSEYARQDIAMAPILDLMRTSSLPAAGSGSPVDMDTYCVDTWPVVFARKKFYGMPAEFMVDKGPWSLKAEIGDVVEIEIVGTQGIEASALQSFQFSGGDGGVFSLKGIVSSIWPVRHQSRRSLSDFQSELQTSCTDEDRMLAESFGFVEYKSPSDLVSVDMPDPPSFSDDEEQFVGDDDRSQQMTQRKKQNPAIVEYERKRRACLKELRKQKETAWRDWSKPLVKPGDTVAVLTAPDKSKLLLVHRFWVEEDERSRHVFFIPGDADLSNLPKDGCEVELRKHSLWLRDTSSGYYIDVLRVGILQMHTGERGVSKYTPISSFGTLQNGEKYVIYRFMLYWDGFEISRGKSSSGDGVYMVCLNIPSQSRSSPNAVRIISLSPPGVDCSVVFQKIEEDIVKGMTEGFVDVDADGVRRRILLDLIGYLGDTPAVNGELDTVGHTGRACCHLCRYYRHCMGLAGSRYTDQSCFGSQTTSGRTFWKHVAVRDCHAQRETCLLLGMKPTADYKSLPLHSLANAMRSAMLRIPRTSQGVPVLSGHLDPYRSCFVAPDHLLTGHFRDCMNLVVKLLPSRRCVEKCESFILGYLHDCELPLQNRLIDHDKRKLYAMSMTEIYALSIVAETGFLKGCSAVVCSSERTSPPSKQCRDAIELVGSCARLISLLWWMPDRDADCQELIERFKRDKGQQWIASIQNETFKHLRKVENICSMPDEDVILLSDPRAPNSTKSRLSKVKSLCDLAVRTVDKPNLHRLVELVKTTLPMVGHISFIGELCFEKTHQVLKRAIRLSNNKNIQLQSMTSAIFTDWQGRLAMLVSQAMVGEKSAVLGCTRLLGGREYITSIGHNVPDDLHSQVLEALGPKACVPAILSSGGKSVIAPHTELGWNDPHKWRMEGHKERVEDEYCGSNVHRRMVFEQLSRIQTERRGMTEFADKATTRNGNRIMVHSVRCGDIVQIICYEPFQKQYHIPFLVNKCSAGTLPGVPEGPAFWMVCSIFTSELITNDGNVWAALRPCTVISEDESLQEHALNSTKVMVGEFVFSIAEINRSMTKVGALHDCDPSACHVFPRRNVINHGDGIPSQTGAKIYLKTRVHGFPPRRG